MYIVSNRKIVIFITKRSIHSQLSATRRISITIRMMARHDQAAREEYLQRDVGRETEPDGVNEVDDVRGEGAQGMQEGGRYEALGIKINISRALVKASQSKDSTSTERSSKEGHILDLQPHTPAMAPQRPKQPCMMISGPRSMACEHRTANCCRRCASVMVEPSILGRKFSVVCAFVRLD
jgi:hypothetical protein